MRTALLAVATAAVMATGPASSGTLDFTEAGATGLVAPIINLSNATLTSTGPNMFIGAPFIYGETNGLGIACGAAVSGSCAQDWSIDFLAPVQALSMLAVATGFGDFVKVSACLGATLLGTVDVTADGTVDLSSLGTLDRLFFDDQDSGNAGIGFGDFAFRDAQVIPLPASGLLLIAGLGALALRRRRTA